MAGNPALSGSRRTRWGLVCAALVLGAAGVFVIMRTHAPRLPALGSYGNLPAAFGRAVAGARLKAVADGYPSDDIRALARLYQANRFNDEALACYAILRKAPGGLTAQDHYYLGDIALYQGDLDQAILELKEVEETEPQYLAARLELGDALFKSGDAAGAAREYESILETMPNQPQAMFSLARIDLMKGGDDKAITRLETLLTAHPEMTSGAGLLAQIFDRRGEKQKALLMTQWSRQSPEPVPDDPWIDELLTNCYDVQRLSLKFEEYYTSGEIDKALPLLDRVEELDPKSYIPQLLRGWSQARAHNDFEAVAQYRMALDKGGDPEKICPYMAQSLIALGRLSDAAKLMAEFYAKKPDSVPILIAYSDVAVRQGDNVTATVLLRRVLEKEPYRVAANMNLAKILWASGERDEAAVCLERVTKVSSSDVVSRALLGEYHLRRSEPLAAIPPLEEAIAQSQKGTPAYTSLTSMLYAAYVEAGSSGADADAVGFLDKAIALDPANPNALAHKAALCAQARKFADAADALEKLRDLQPNNPTIYLSLGDVLYHEGKPDEARVDWHRAMLLTSSGNTALREALNARIDAPITEDTFR